MRIRAPAHGKFYVQTICLSVSVARAPRHAVRKGQSTFLTVCSGLLAICLRFVSNRTNFEGKNIRNLLESDKDKNRPNKQFVVNLPFAFTPRSSMFFYPFFYKVLFNLNSFRFFEDSPTALQAFRVINTSFVL